MFRRRPFHPRRHREAGRTSPGFTLVEVLISTTIAGGVLVAVFATFLFLARSGANMRNYVDMESQARTALELFAEDTRQAGGVIWNSPNSLTLVVNNLPVIYTYDSSAGTFSREFRPKASSTDTQITVLVSGITQFNFLAYSITGVEYSDFSTPALRAAANVATKQVQLSLSALRTASTVTGSTNLVLSARYVLRNRRVTA